MGKPGRDNWSEVVEPLLWGWVTYRSSRLVWKSSEKRIWTTGIWYLPVVQQRVAVVNHIEGKQAVRKLPQSIRMAPLLNHSGKLIGWLNIWLKSRNWSPSSNGSAEEVYQQQKWQSSDLWASRAIGTWREFQMHRSQNSIYYSEFRCSPYHPLVIDLDRIGCDDLQLLLISLDNFLVVSVLMVVRTVHFALKFSE